MNVTFLYAGPHPAHAEWARSVNASFVPNRTGIRIRNIARLAKSITVVRKIPGGTDILLCEGGSDLPAGHRWKRKNPGKKLVLIVDDPKLYFLPRMNRIKKNLYMNALESVDLFIPTSPMMKELIPEEFRSRGRIAQLYVDYKRFHCEKPNLESRNLVFVGLANREKGVDRIISAFRKINSKHPESMLYVVGDGPLKSESSGNMIFTGYDPVPEKYMKKGSICISLARIEPFGIAILEAMACGLIPVITEGVGIRHAVRRISPELVVKDENEAAGLIEKIFSDNVLMEECSKKAQSIAMEFTRERSIEMFRKALSIIQP